VKYYVEQNTINTTIHCAGHGKLTHDEFMQGHEAKFKDIDANNDGVIDQSERETHMQQRRQKKGKCGGSKQQPSGQAAPQS
jgi:hypothetical protein